MNEYDHFEAEMIASGKSLDEIEVLWSGAADNVTDSAIDDEISDGQLAEDAELDEDARDFEDSSFDERLAMFRAEY